MKESPSTPTSEDFRTELNAQIQRATRQGRPHVEINAGELHRVVGGYPGESHRMPMCCQAMRDELRNGDATVVFETHSGNGAALTIRYDLPRPGTLRA
jgi:hypothetical protein